MPTSDPSIDELFRQATDQLHPDVDRLVAGGLDRGRVRRRRHLVGTTAAVLATFVVIGAGAVVVPHLDLDAGQGASVAAGGPTATPTTTPTMPPAPAGPVAPQLSQPQGPTVAASDIPAVLAELVPGHQVGRPLTHDPYPLVDRPEEKVVHFQVDGMLTTIVIGRASASLAYDCADESTVECRTLADGTVLQVPAPTTADQVTMRGVIAMGETWMVDVMSYNAPEGKDVPPLQAEPPLTEDELVTVATSDAWFESAGATGQ